MASILPPPFVKYFVAVLFKDTAALDAARTLFVKIWGKTDFEGSDHEFDITDYYAPEMGQPLYRRMLSFATLYDPKLLIDMKIQCNEIEEQLCVDKKRVVNCDAGYLDHNKVLLASAKEAGQKVYLDKGIYADLVGRYKSGKYQPFEWSFPDFKDGRYDKELLMMRTLYLSSIKKMRKQPLSESN